MAGEGPVVVVDVDVGLGVGLPGLTGTWVGTSVAEPTLKGHSLAVVDTKPMVVVVAWEKVFGHHSWSALSLRCTPKRFEYGTAPRTAYMDLRSLRHNPSGSIREERWQRQSRHDPARSCRSTDLTGQYVGSGGQKGTGRLQLTSWSVGAHAGGRTRQEKRGSTHSPGCGRCGLSGDTGFWSARLAASAE